MDETPGNVGQRIIIYVVYNLGVGSTTVQRAIVNSGTVNAPSLPITISSSRNLSFIGYYQWSLDTVYQAQVISNQGIRWPDYPQLTPLSLPSTAGGPCTYSMWAGSSIVWPGSRSTVGGNVHVNGDFTMSGSTNDIIGNLEYTTTFIAGNSANVFGGIVHTVPNSQPFTYSINDYKPGGTAAQAAQSVGMYHYVSGDLHFSTNNVTIAPGLYYVTGSVQVSASSLKGNVTFVAEQNISVSGSYNDFRPYDKTLLFYSNTGSIQAISGSYNTMRGVIYDPSGQASLPGSYNTLQGYIIASQVNVPGSNWLINPDSTYCPA